MVVGGKPIDSGRDKKRIIYWRNWK